MHRTTNPPQRVLAIVIFCSFSIAGIAQQSTRSKLEQLTTDLVRLNSQYQNSSSSDKSAIVGELTAVATQRRDLLNSLMESDPAEVIKVALPSSVRNSLPTNVQTSTEHEVIAEGVLEVSMEMHGPMNHLSGMTVHYGLAVGTQHLRLHFAAHPPTHLLTGSVVRIHGVKGSNDVALASGATNTSTSTSSLQVVSAASATTLGSQNILVILVNFQDLSSQPWTPQAASSLIFGTGTGTVNGFYRDNSFGQASLTGDVAGWFTVPLSSTSCSTSSIQTYAQQAAQKAGYVLANYSRFVYAFPSTRACAWTGWSNVGGSPSNSWINGNMDLTTVAHELGHAFGLYHSHGLSCTSGGVAVPYSSSCSSLEYGDQLDTMGAPYPMYFNASQKERLGWLNGGGSPPITTVTTSGTYSLAPYETQDGLPKALKILRSSSSNSWYYLESRQVIGDDAYIQSNLVTTGILFHLSSPSNGNSSDILDMEPNNGWGFQAPTLQAGHSYTDSAAGVTITPIAVSSAGATVQVTFTGATCAHANPTLSVAPSQSQYVVAGTPVNFTATVKNNDSSACSSSNFNLAAGSPSGWTASWNNSFLTAAPGATATATLTITSPAGTPDGFYNIGFSAANASTAGYSASASATYVLSTPAQVSVSVSTDKSSYSAGQRVLITVTALSGSSPDAAANVTVTITAPGGKVTTVTGITGSNGVLSLSYKLARSAVPGSYQVKATLPVMGASSSVAASSVFVVQ